MRITEDELVAATLSYRSDRRDHDRAAAEAAETAALLATVRRLDGELPSDLGLLELAESEATRADRELTRTGARLRASAERLVDVAGWAAAGL